MATMTLGLFVDCNNLYYGGLKKYNGRLDYKRFIERMSEHGRIQTAYAYGIGCDAGTESFKGLLRHTGFECRWADSKYNWNVGLAMDVVRQIDFGKIDMVILGSGDPFLSHCADYVRQQGLKCYCYGFQISDSMKGAVDRYYEIPSEFLIETAMVER